MSTRPSRAESASEKVERLMQKTNLRLMMSPAETHSKRSTSKNIEEARRHNCWRCQDVGFEIIEESARPCKCQLRKIVRASLDQIPPRFGNPKLSRLAPISSRHSKQAAVIEEIRRHPDQSYLFLGANGSGKTHFGFALYRYALSKKKRVIACSVRELLEDYRKAAMSAGSENDAQVFRPRVLPDDLKVRGTRWMIFLDEFEKARPTEFAAEMLFGLLDAAYQYEQQLIVTSNFDIRKLITHWGRLDEVWGTSIVRRLEGCTVIEMF